MALFNNHRGLQLTFAIIALSLSVLATATTTDKSINDQPPQSFIGQIGSLAWGVFCVIGPIAQYYDILQGNKVTTLSPYVIMILLISNIIRVFFWLASPFEIALVLQSFVMIVMQYLLLQKLTQILTEQVKADKENPNGIKKVTIFNSPIDLKTFWTWTDAQSYSIVIMALISVLSVGYMLFNNYQWYGSLLGYLSLLIEACLGVPQVIKNLKEGCEGLSPFLFFTWLAGDFAKTIGFIATGSPFPFIMCGIVQMLTDVVIILQIANANYKGMRKT